MGTFDRVGTPRRWLWPVLRVLQRRRILFPVWEHDVPFTIENARTRERCAPSAPFTWPQAIA